MIEEEKLEKGLPLKIIDNTYFNDTHSFAMGELVFVKENSFNDTIIDISDMRFRVQSKSSGAIEWVSLDDVAPVNNSIRKVE